MDSKKYDDYIKILKEKLDRSFMLIEASLDGLQAYDPSIIYTPKELEPYDALADRFIRCVEIFIKYFKAYEYKNFAYKSLTLRDGLNVMEKVGLISDVTIWLKMRDIRNRIVHDYLPEQTKEMFDSIMNDFFTELKFCKKNIEKSF